MSETPSSPNIFGLWDISCRLVETGQRKLFSIQVPRSPLSKAKTRECLLKTKLNCARSYLDCLQHLVKVASIENEFCEIQCRLDIVECQHFVMSGDKFREIGQFETFPLLQLRSNTKYVLSQNIKKQGAVRVENTRHPLANDFTKGFRLTHRGHIRQQRHYRQ